MQMKQTTGGRRPGHKYLGTHAARKLNQAVLRQQGVWPSLVTAAWARHTVVHSHLPGAHWALPPDALANLRYLLSPSPGVGPRRPERHFVQDRP